jgi:predicted dehydrogenase
MTVQRYREEVTVSPGPVTPLRIGILGAARITPDALCKPARGHRRVQVTAVAARDQDRAREFATKWDIPRVHSSYQALLDDPDIDAVYNPLPNGLHGHWTMAAVDAGKHVLCEKPFTADEAEARAVADHVDGSGKVVMEAFHWRYHPLADRVLELLVDGAIGEPRSARAALCFPIRSTSDIRWNPNLAGGALMDAGCYPIHMLRTFLAGEPTVRSAQIWERMPGIDRLAEAELDFDDGVTATMRASMWSRHLLAVWVKIVGTEGELRILNPLAPQVFSWLSWRSRGTRHHERPERSTTYLHQLNAFAAAALDGSPIHTGTDDAIGNMATIDAIYRRAGLEPRRPSVI